VKTRISNKDNDRKQPCRKMISGKTLPELGGLCYQRCRGGGNWNTMERCSSG